MNAARRGGARRGEERRVSVVYYTLTKRRSIATFVANSPPRVETFFMVRRVPRSARMRRRVRHPSSVLRPSSQRTDHELDYLPPRRPPRLHHELVLAQPPGPSEPPRGRGGGGGGGETVLIARATEPRSSRRIRGSDGPESSLRASSSRVERTVPRVAADRRRGRPSSLAAAPVRPRRPLVLPPRAEALPSVVRSSPSSRGGGGGGGGSRAHPHHAGAEPRRSRAAPLAAARGSNRGLPPPSTPRAGEGSRASAAGRRLRLRRRRRSAGRRRGAWRPRRRSFPPDADADAGPTPTPPPNRPGVRAADAPRC